MTQNEYEIYTYNSHNIYILVFSKLHKYLVPTYYYSLYRYLLGNLIDQDKW